MADAYSGIFTPMSTKQFEAMAEDVMSHFNANGAALQQVGVDLRRLLPRARNVSGRSGLFGADLHVGAWQVARQFAQADAACRAGAAAIGKAHQIYYGTFHRPAGGGTGGQFDAG